MKKIIALTFFGILTYAFADTLEPETPEQATLNDEELGSETLEPKKLEDETSEHATPKHEELGPGTLEDKKLENVSPEEETHKNETPKDETSEDETSGDETSKDDTSKDETSGDRKPESERNEDEKPKPFEDENLQQETLEDGKPKHNTLGDEKLENHEKLEDEPLGDEAHENGKHEAETLNEEKLETDTRKDEKHEPETLESNKLEHETSLKEEKRESETNENEKDEHGTVENEKFENETVKHKPLEYGTGSCQYLKYKEDFDGAKFFNGTWYLTHATSSVRVNGSTICRDYVTTTKGTGNNRFYSVSYGSNKNGEDGNHNDVHCSGIQNELSKEQYNFVCFFNNGGTNMEVDAYFLATDYDKFAVVYRCITVGEHFEDNVFVLYRDKNPRDDEVNKILKPYGLTVDNFISRKNNATCE